MSEPKEKTTTVVEKPVETETKQTEKKETTTTEKPAEQQEVGATFPDNKEGE